MATVSSFVEQLFNGLTLGMVYVLLAAGLSIIFGVMDVINFSHGELFALGAYFALSIVNPLGETGFWIALVVAPLVVGVIGVLIERLTVRPLYGRDPLYHILLTFGLVLIISDLIQLVWGRSQHQLAVPDVLNQSVAVLGVRLSLYSYFMIFVGAVLAVGTWLVLNRTTYGMIVRAGSQDREMVRNLGIDIDSYYTLVFGFGAALAAVGGIVLGGYQNVNPGMGNSVIIPAFIIVVLGGLGSFRGAVFGGLLVGVVQTLTRTYVPFLEGLTIFLLMIAVLLVKPRGLFGNPEWQTTAPEEGELLLGAHGGVFTRETRVKLGAVAVLVLAVAPVILVATGNDYYVSLLNEMLIWAIFALSLDFVMGYAGLVSLGHTMFYGIGAYAAALVMLHLTSSLVVALAGAMVLCALVAWVVGSLSIRVSGVYFAMITLAFAQLFYNAVFKFSWTGGSDGLLGFEAVLGLGGVGVALSEAELTLAGLTITPTMVFYYLALVLAVAALLFARRFMNAPFGSVLRSLSESEERAEFIGYDVTQYKRRAFVISGALAGLAGGLLAANPETFVVSPDQTLYWINSGEVIVMTLLGGMGTLFGPMLGAGVFIGAEDVLATYTEQWRMVIGAVFVLFVLFVPRGLVSVPSLLARRWGERNGSPTGIDDSEVRTDD
ncbi:ABC transporter permease [Halococcus sediminicola]|uniref:ABC transporter permease n=1 Tax=Halococcus sediminicola TaxID=1264579 RepID=UPI000679905B|nr:ABC transporter permease [Halococcus sediminicola]